jgi:hypothetical protein
MYMHLSSVWLFTVDLYLSTLFSRERLEEYSQCTPYHAVSSSRDSWGQKGASFWAFVAIPGRPPF